MFKKIEKNCAKLLIMLMLVMGLNLSPIAMAAQVPTLINPFNDPTPPPPPPAPPQNKPPTNPTAKASVEAATMNVNENFDANKVVKYKDRSDGSGNFVYDDDEFMCFKSKDGLTAGAHDITLTYSESHLISKVTVTHANVDPEFNVKNTLDFDIQVSNDYVKWETVDSVKDNLSTITTHEFTPQLAKYVRLHITKNHNNGITYIYDIRAFELQQNWLSLTAPTAKTYALGEKLTFELKSDFPVTVTGSPTLPVVIGSKTVQATFVTGTSGTTTLQFEYVIQKGDVDQDGIAIGGNLVDGTLKSMTNSNMPSTLPVLSGGTNVKVNAPFQYGAVGFESTTQSGDESQLSPVINVKRVGGSDSTVTVKYSVTGGTATGSGSDYTLADGILTFADGEINKTIPLSILNDAIKEANETVVIELSLNAGSDGTLGANNKLTYTINNDDYDPVQISNGPLPDGIQNSGYSTDLAPTGGKAPLTCSLNLGSLPSGLTLSAAGVISGTPTNMGDFTFEVSAVDSNTPQGSVTKSYTLKIKAAPHHMVSASPTTVAPIAGEDTAVKLTVKNSDGTVDKSFSGEHSVIISIADASSAQKEGTVNLTSFTGSQPFNLSFVNGEATLSLSLKSAEKHIVGFEVTGVNIQNASINITPKHAAAKSMVIVSDVTAPEKYGQPFKVQPVIKLVDAYGNECTTDNTTVVTASKNDAGSWTLGGTLQKTASSGIVTFTNLTATNTAAVTGAEIAFNATGVDAYVSPGMALAEKPTVVSVTPSVIPVFDLIEGQAIHTPTTSAVLILSDTTTVTIPANEFASNHLEWQWNNGTPLVDGALVDIADNGKTIVLKETVSNVQTASIPVVVVPTAISSISQIAPNPALFKTTYEVDDVFDPSGIAVELTYTNGQKITVAYADFALKGLELVLRDNENLPAPVSLSNPLALTANADILSVVDQSGKGIECPIGVLVVQPLLKIDFLNTDNVSVLETVYVKRGATAAATLTPVPSNPNTLFGGWSGDLTNLQSDKQFSPIFIPKPPKKLSTVDVNAPLPNLTIIEGGNLDLSGLTAKITYDDASTKDVALVDFATDGLVLNKTTGSAITLTDEGFALTISYNGSVKATVGVIHVTPNVATCQTRVAADTQALTVGLTGTDALDKVTTNVVLPTLGTLHQSNITWVSSHPQYISTVGVVTRPIAAVGNTTVQLTGTVNYLGQSVEKVISMTVIAQPPLPPPPPVPPTPSGGGGGGGGGGGAPTPTPVTSPTPVVTAPPVPTPVLPVPAVPAPVNPASPANPPAPKALEPVKAKLDQKGLASAVVGAKELKDELAEAKKSKEKELNLKVDAPKGAKAVETKLGKDVLTATKADGLKGLNLDTPLGDISFNDKALKTLQEKVKGEVSVTVETKMVNGKTMYDLRVMSGGKVVTGLAGNVEVSVPYTLKAGETAKNFKFYVADAKGKPVLAKGAVYNPKTKEVTFKSK